MRVILPVVAIVAAILMVMSLIYPEQLRGAFGNGAMPALIQMTMVAIIVGAGLFGRSDSEGPRMSMSQGVKYGAIWVGITLFLIAAYSQRASFQQLWAGITGEINPSSAQSNGETVTLRKTSDGHFWAEVVINGQTIRMMVDTGATSIALDPADARRVGVDMEALSFDIPTMTANGSSKVAGTRLRTVRVGSIVRDNMPATVMQATDGVSLLGMDFLGELSEVKARGDVLTLRD